MDARAGLGSILAVALAACGGASDATGDAGGSGASTGGGTVTGGPSGDGNGTSGTGTEDSNGTATGGGSGGTATGTDGVDPDLLRQVMDILEAFDGLNIHTLDQEALAALGPDAIAALDLAFEDSRKKIRWGALMGLSGIGRVHGVTDDVVPALSRGFDDPEQAVRVTAGELVIGVGHKTGFDALIDALDSDALLQPSEPPTTVHTNTARVLTRYTDVTFDEEAQWRTWWEENGDDLQWDPIDEKYH